VSKHKQIITSVVMGSAVAAISVTTVSAATQSTVHSKQNLGKNLIAQTRPPANQQPLVPNPKITIDGIAPTPGVGLATPTMPRAIAPPVGDISVSNIDAAVPQLNLSSSKSYSITATQSARELLKKIAYEANLNITYADTPIVSDSKSTTPADPLVSVNFRNEPIQNVFNYVLQISGLEANRIGNTIFIGTRLPDSVRETIVRTLRMNQVTSSAAANFLATQGAESQIPVNTVTVTNSGTDLAASATGGGSGGGTGATGSALSKITETRSASIQSLKASTENGPLVLKGLSVSTDERLNSITLVGTPRKVAMATELLTRLDARRRQVALNVKIVDVNLSNTNALKTSLSFQSGDTVFSADQGSALINFGNQPVGTLPTPQLAATKFLSAIQTQITSGNGKILTDPTLVVQEGQRSTVNLTQEVFGGFMVENTFSSNGVLTGSVNKPIIKNAGLIVDLLVNRIDDNGFVSVSVSPTVSAPGDSINTSAGLITLLQSRTLNSGEVRLRDGQTLILSGIIQESDTATVTKVPILGDIPLLGALFRSTNKGSKRQEVVVLLTPQILNDNKTEVNYTPGSDARIMIKK
jgi:type IV pilus assembly protein PilQ